MEIKYCFFIDTEKNVFSKALILNLGHTDLPLCNVPKQEHPSVLSMSTARLIGKYWNNTWHKNSKNFRFNGITVTSTLKSAAALNEFFITVFPTLDNKVWTSFINLLYNKKCILHKMNDIIICKESKNKQQQK